MTDTESRLAALEARLQTAEDELAIIRLVASYGALVDSGSTELAPELFGTDGVYDVSYGRVTGAEGVAALLRSKDHQDLLASGVAHVMGLPWIRISGDEAVAINCTQLFLRDGDGFSIFRVAHNVWKLARKSDGGWTIRDRVNRLISKDGESVSLLANAI